MQLALATEGGVLLAGVAPREPVMIEEAMALAGIGDESLGCRVERALRGVLQSGVLLDESDHNMVIHHFQKAIRSQVMADLVELTPLERYGQHVPRTESLVVFPFRDSLPLVMGFGAAGEHSEPAGDGAPLAIGSRAREGMALAGFLLAHRGGDGAVRPPLATAATIAVVVFRALLPGVACCLQNFERDQAGFWGLTALDAALYHAHAREWLDSIPEIT